jgi:hypothetical protein
MSTINYEIALYNSPSFEELVSELYRISRYKRNIYRKIKNEDEYKQKLSFEERLILKDLSEKENNILLEILVNKYFLDLPQDSFNFISQQLKNKYNPD